MIKNIGWTLGNDCPCKCKHCYSLNVREKGSNLTKEIVDRVILEIKKLDVKTINLGGNEPIYTNGLSIRDSLLPYILEELNLNNIKVGLTTSGTSLISLYSYYPECLKLLNDVDISLDSPIEAEHNVNRGGDMYKPAMESLEICKEYGIDSGIIMCAMNWNFTVDRLEQLIKLSRKYNSTLRFNILKPVSKEHMALLPTKEQIMEGYKYLFSKCEIIDCSEPILARMVKTSSISGCSCGISSMRINSISPDGKIAVSPCVYMHDYRVGNLLDDNLLDIVNSKQFKDFFVRKDNYKKIEGCADCENSEICRGGCFAMAYTYEKCKTGNKNLYARDPFCSQENSIKFDNIGFSKEQHNLVHQNYLCTWIGKPKALEE
jgi:radical SAM protein with 4Fe4S-binding SPASM domain